MFILEKKRLLELMDKSSCKKKEKTILVSPQRNDFFTKQLKTKESDWNVVKIVEENVMKK